MMAPVSSCRIIDEDTFVARFRPLPNRLDRDASFDFGEGGCLYAAAGRQLAHVLKQAPLTVWTVVDDDFGSVRITSGLHLVNRIGYLVSAEPVEQRVAYTVPLD